MVKNESDIIESFVRHNITFIDKMVILDNGSTDGTLVILNKLIEEGLPIYLIQDPNPTYSQSQIMTRLLHLVLDEFHPAFVIPIDADEFLSANGGQPRDLIKRLDNNKVHYIPWVTYVPTRQDNKNELFIPKRITHRRMKEPTVYYKVIIPGDLAKENDLSLIQGNHDVKAKRGQIKNFDHTLFIAHYPIRSTAQVMSKYLVGWLAYLAKPDHIKGEGYHWEEAYHKIKENIKISEEELTEMAMNFAVEGVKINNQQVCSPLSLEHIEKSQINYQEDISQSYLKNLLNYSEHLAREYSRFAGQTSIKGSEPDYLEQLKKKQNYKKTTVGPLKKKNVSFNFSILLTQFRKIMNHIRG